MPNSAHAFTFIISLAAVVNGMGIVRLLTALSEFLRFKNKANIDHYWVYSCFASLQLVLHIFFWWSLWSLRSLESFNFFKYLYLLIGPTLLFLATSLLVPALDGQRLNMKEIYYNNKKTFFTVMSLAWLWGIMLRPITRNEFGETLPLFLFFLISSVLLRIADYPKVHAALALFQWAVLLVFIVFFGLELGDLSTKV